MALIDMDALLTPISDDNPAGDNLEYGAVAELERLATTKPGKDNPTTGERGDPEEPDWRKVRELALALLSQTKDLRGAVILTRSLLALQGLAGLGEGIQLVYLMNERFWSSVHPRLDPDEGDDPVERLNALANLDDQEGLIRSLRSTRILESREVGNYTLRDLDIMAGRINPPEGTEPPSRGLMEAAWRSGDQSANAARRAGVEAALAACNDLIKLFRDKTNDAPSVDTLRTMLKRVKDFYDAVADDGTPENETEAADPSGDADTSHVAVSGGGAKAGGALASRADAVKLLQQVAVFLRKTEPSSPAPMFIDRAVKMLQSDFATIVRELMPDSKERIEMLGGISLEPGSDQ
jgi:type VI secretion system protein ImpA